MSDSKRATALIDLFSRPALWVALRAVCDHPQQELRVETPFVDVGQAAALDPALLGASAHQPGALAITERMPHFTQRGQKWRFLKVFDRRIIRRDLMPANQFVAYFVRYSIKLIKGFAYSIAADDEMLEYFHEFLYIIRRLNSVWDSLSPSFKHAQLTVIPVDNQLLQFDPQYHVILQTYLACESV
jgi:predicted component of viral defense system (DUF524 family)